MITPQWIETYLIRLIIQEKSFGAAINLLKPVVAQMLN